MSDLRFGAHQVGGRKTLEDILVPLVLIGDPCRSGYNQLRREEVLYGTGHRWRFEEDCPSGQDVLSFGGREQGCDLTRLVLFLRQAGRTDAQT